MLVQNVPAQAGTKETSQLKLVQDHVPAHAGTRHFPAQAGTRSRPPPVPPGSRRRRESSGSTQRSDVESSQRQLVLEELNLLGRLGLGRPPEQVDHDRIPWSSPRLRCHCEADNGWRLFCERCGSRALVIGPVMLRMGNLQV